MRERKELKKKTQQKKKKNFIRSSYLHNLMHMRRHQLMRHPHSQGWKVVNTYHFMCFQHNDSYVILKRALWGLILPFRHGNIVRWVISSKEEIAEDGWWGWDLATGEVNIGLSLGGSLSHWYFLVKRPLIRLALAFFSWISAIFSL